MKDITPAQRRTLDCLIEVRAQAVEHVRVARELSVQRRHLIDKLLADGFSQADLARELGVTRQAIQKMMAAG
ncbi:TrfB-related DNA-binding protein [Microbacterium horticulturae]|uniref:TrfB-related DNA-binding protein n=1 Tax=Microbacterium horticulturae TaxID=3028316 RepID=A0ABY8BZT0_9MICO|nr:TrfB-related DNA-binding protein [Microbacterium sp. KACC 23027]WEG09485.1 TrfB-related DNA-binding protein [Microbacterium sp. KACC 23027]